MDDFIKKIKKWKEVAEVEIKIHSKDSIGSPEEMYFHGMIHVLEKVIEHYEQNPT